jgi:glycosyltransferase involved in cell wall biosynthesis
VSVRPLRSSDTIGAGRGDAVVVVAATASAGALMETLAHLEAHTDPAVRVLVACAEPNAERVASLEVAREVGLLALGAASGAAAALGAVHAWAPHADLVLVREGVLVGPGWLDGLREAAHHDSIVMTASALSEPVADGVEVEQRASAVRAAAAPLHPALPAASESCSYLRAAGLELVGAPDEQSGGVSGFSARISALGLVHVLADEVWVAGPDESEPAEVPPGALRRAFAVSRAALRPLSVTIDARALGAARTGTRTYILDLIAAMAPERSLALRVVLPPDTHPEVLAELEANEAIELISYAEAAAGVELTDVVHRPQQIFSADDLALLRMLGERVVVSHHDLIAYRCADYHESAEQWQDFRRVTRLALAQADMVVFPSHHARNDALREDLVSPERARVVAIGADRVWPQPAATQVRPEGVGEDESLLVCIGADYAHKNRPFALALALALHERHGWSGRLVLAGPHVEHGSSREHERQLLEGDPALARLVLDIGPVEDSGRAWLYAHADAIVYPSVYEGYGLVPFEAAQAGVPCFYAPAGALAELAGASVPPLVPWDPDASADAVAPLLERGAARAEHLRALNEAAAAATWSAAVPSLRAVYEQALASPYRSSAPRVADDLDREAHIVALAASAEHDRARAGELQRANADAQRANQQAQDANRQAQLALGETRDELAQLRASVGGFAETSAGGFLTPAQRRGLLRVASRALLRRALFAPFALGGRGGGGDGAGAPRPPDAG